jgi:hypothetical protein
MIAAVSELLTWLTGGSALAKVLLAICAPIFGLICWRYVGILGADRRRPAQRQVYDALRNSLIGGNLAARLYARWLGVMLDRVDRLFGDAGMADRTLFPHLFWLRTPAPLWTAPALERCLLLALIYPIATILVIWAVSGHVGPAENALHLNPRLIAWQRWLAAAAFGFSMFALWCAVRETGWKRFVRTIIYIVYIVLFVIAVYLWVAPAGPMIVGGAHAASLTTKIAMVLAPTAPPAVTIAVALFSAVIVAGAIAVISAGLGALQRLRWEGAFLTLFIPGMILACFGAATWLSSLRVWQILGPLLLFLGLFTLLNTPFDWVSLGLTRALLRRGLELGGWAPYFLAIVDAVLAAGVIVVLTLAMVIGVQLFDAAGVPDDAVTMRGKLFSAPRDNVVYELGLFSGALGRERCFFVTPEGTDIHLPTDLLGMTAGWYETGRRDGNLQAAVGPFCTKVRNKIREMTLGVDFLSPERNAQLHTGWQTFTCRCTAQPGSDIFLFTHKDNQWWPRRERLNHTTDNEYEVTTFFNNPGRQTIHVMKTNDLGLLFLDNYFHFVDQTKQYPAEGLCTRVR